MRGEPDLDAVQPARPTSDGGQIGNGSLADRAGQGPLAMGQSKVTHSRSVNDGVGGLAMIELVDSDIVYRNPKPYLRSIQARHPSLARFDDGELLIAFDLGQSDESLDYRTYRARSFDGGKSWQTGRRAVRQSGRSADLVLGAHQSGWQRGARLRQSPLSRRSG